MNEWINTSATGIIINTYTIQFGVSKIFVIIFERNILWLPRQKNTMKTVILWNIIVI